MEENSLGIESHFRDGICDGKLSNVIKTLRTSSLLFSEFTSPGTESNTQSCSSAGKKGEKLINNELKLVSKSEKYKH